MSPIDQELHDELVTAAYDAERPRLSWAAADRIATALEPSIERIVAKSKAEALREFARKWADWIAQGAPQTRGGAAYRAVCEAQEIEAALGEPTGQEATS